jgi:hypothetical protein
MAHGIYQVQAGTTGVVEGPFEMLVGRVFIGWALSVRGVSGVLALFSGQNISVGVTQSTGVAFIWSSALS